MASDSQYFYMLDRLKPISTTTDRYNVRVLTKEFKLEERAEKNGTTVKQEVEKLLKQGPGILYCLNARNGEVVWKSPKEVAATYTVVSEKYERVITGRTGVYQVIEDVDKGRTFKRQDGSQLKSLNASRVGLNDYNWSGTDIRSFKRIQRKKTESNGFGAKTKGCGISSASTYFTLIGNGLFRYSDSSGETTQIYHFNGIKASCWVSSIPACGVVSQTALGYGCQCNQHSRIATFVLESIPQ